MKIKGAFYFFGLGFILLFLIVKTDVAINESLNALMLCGKTVIPTLFPFFVISGLMQNLGVIAFVGRIFSPVSRVLFKTSGKGAVAFLIGILCGYPTGAKVISGMCINNEMSKKEGERLLAFCNNSGPLFIIGAVGDMMLKNHRQGIFLYVVHIISALLTGVVLSFFVKEENTVKREPFVVTSMGEAITKSIESAVYAILNVCGFVVFFSVLCVVFKDPFLVSILEITTGAKLLINSGLDAEKTLIILSGILGFGGVCVALQVQSAVKTAKLSLKTYISGKSLQALISMTITFLWLELNKKVPVFATEGIAKYENAYFLLIFVVGTSLLLGRLTKKG